MWSVFPDPWDEMGDKGHLRPFSAARRLEFLVDFRKVSVLKDLVGLHPFIDFTEKGIHNSVPARAAHPGLRIDDDVSEENHSPAS